MEKILTRFKKRSNKHPKAKGMPQKLYVIETASAKNSGVYFFDSKDNFEASMNSNLEKSIDEAFTFVESPTKNKLEAVSGPLKKQQHEEISSARAT
jgi:hypothetical protein